MTRVKAGAIGSAAEGKFIYLFLEALLEEESVGRVEGITVIDPIGLG